MSNRKVPCGGFGLDENFLGMNENGELSLVSGASEDKAYKQLVTDGDGNAKWEDRLAYDDSRVVVDVGEYLYVHVSDDTGELNATKGSKMYFTIEDGSLYGSGVVDTFQSIGDFIWCQWCVIVPTDNAVMSDIVFPKKGVYFYKSGSEFVSSVANFDESGSDSDPVPEPVITWDGSIGTLKKLDKKYTGLLAFSILKGGTNNYSATASYQEVRDAYYAKIPIFATMFTTDGCYPATEITERDGSFVFHCGTYSVTYSADGTIGETGPS